MFKGIAFALGACFIWGLIFVVPGFMSEFSPIEVSLGRFLVYGLVSALIFCKSKLQGSLRYPRAIWIKALHFSFIMTIGYYTLLVLALRHSTPTIGALILGISPITIAFYGNWKQKETTFKRLIIPSALILLGLVIINAPHLETSADISSYIFGLVCGFLALIAWSWFVVANAQFLKQNPKVGSSDWSTLIGVAALAWALFFILFLSVFFENQFDLKTYFTPGSELTRFLIGSAILGVLCSWVGAFLWNQASFHLPISLAGQLTIFETIFGVLFVYILERHLPSVTESIGIASLLIAIIYGIRQFSRKRAYESSLTPH